MNSGTRFRGEQDSSNARVITRSPYYSLSRTELRPDAEWTEAAPGAADAGTG